jgi:hypothetical protein
MNIPPSMIGPTLTGGTSRVSAVTWGRAPIGAGTAARVLAIHARLTPASVTRVCAVIHAMRADHVLVVIRASAAMRAPPAWGGVAARTRC